MYSRILCCLLKQVHSWWLLSLERDRVLLCTHYQFANTPQGTGGASLGCEPNSSPTRLLFVLYQLKFTQLLVCDIVLNQCACHYVLHEFDDLLLCSRSFEIYLVPLVNELIRDLFSGLFEPLQFGFDSLELFLKGLDPSFERRDKGTEIWILLQTLYSCCLAEGDV